MRRLGVVEFLTLDGVMQGLGSPDEDRDGGFEHGGWHLQYFDDMSQKWVLDNLNEAGGFLLGRRTYEGFAGHWPNASEEEQVIAVPLNSKPKFARTFAAGAWNARRAVLPASLLAKCAVSSCICRA